MKYHVSIGEKQQIVEIRRQQGGKYIGLLDGQPIDAEIRALAPGVYSVLWDGELFEVRVEPRDESYRVMMRGQEFFPRVRDPRRLARRSGGTLEAEGRQNITAPMPGKVIKILVREAAEVEAGQGLIVVEAMKMQNEIRSPKKGVVEKICVSEGASVGVGEALMVVA